MISLPRASAPARHTAMPWLPAPTWGDVVAAISVALLLIPQSLAYAELAGLPAHMGLLAAAVPPIAAGAFGSSPNLQTGPVALTALVTLGALSTIEEPATAAYIELAALLAVMVGIIRIALGIARLGHIAYLMSAPVVLGFTTGAAVIIASSQIPSVLGVEGADGAVLGNAARALFGIADWHWAAIGVAGATATVIVAGRWRFGRHFPGVLLAVSLAILLASFTSYDAGVVGNIPAQLPVPDPSNVPWGRMPTLLVAAMVIAVVDFAEPAAIARRFAEEDDEPWDASRELTGQGVANVASGLVGGFPVGGSFSRSSLNRLAGGETRWSGIFVGLIVLCFFPMAPLLEDLPRAALAATVIVAVYKLIDVPGMVRCWRSDRADGLVAAVTAGFTLLMEPRIHYAVVVAIAFSVVVRVLRKARHRVHR